MTNQPNTKGHPYHVWREQHGYQDNQQAREKYAEYQQQLDILKKTDEPKKRGRKPEGLRALTPAEKQKRYRDRQRARKAAIRAGEPVTSKIIDLETPFTQALKP